MAIRDAEKTYEQLTRLREYERQLSDQEGLNQWDERNLRAIGAEIARLEEEEAKEMERIARIIKVRFSIEDGQAKGTILQDAPGKARSKIVFIARSCHGPAPTHGMETAARVVHETKPKDPRRGALFVELISDPK